MEIRVNGKLAVLKNETSFEYVSENRLFSGSDGYTLSITFPLRNCKTNIEIFGMIYRKDVTAEDISFECEIRDKGFVKFGSLTIIEINETELKAQFLEGKSEQNFEKEFDDTYINELFLGSPEITNAESVTPEQAWDPQFNNFESVALPWWNDSDSGLPHNFAVLKNGKFQWEDFTTEISWQPYLLYITKKICEEVKYSFDFSSWENNDQFKYLIICNTLPGAWGLANYARALPRWTVDEYFEKLGLFLGGDFFIDHRAKHISFRFNSDALKSAQSIALYKILEEHSVKIEDEDVKCDYIETKNLVYKHDDNEMWKYYSCKWFIDWYKDDIIRYDTLSQLIEDNKIYSDWNNVDRGRPSTNKSEKILYAEDVDTYFIVRAIELYENDTETVKCILQPINSFGGRIVDERDDAEEVELEFTPARIDFTEDKYGSVLFMNLSYKDDTNWRYSGTRPGGYVNVEDDIKQSVIQKKILQGEDEDKAEYYSCIFLAYWTGMTEDYTVQPHPIVEDVEIFDDWSGYTLHDFSLRLNNKTSPNHNVIHKINPRQKLSIKFLSNEIPDVLSVFFIKGKKYVCEKITVTFTENGMSQLMKGEFYQITDS